MYSMKSSKTSEVLLASLSSTAASAIGLISTALLMAGVVVLGFAPEVLCVASAWLVMSEACTASLVFVPVAVCVSVSAPAGVGALMAFAVTGLVMEDCTAY